MGRKERKWTAGVKRKDTWGKTVYQAQVYVSGWEGIKYDRYCPHDHTTEQEALACAEIEKTRRETDSPWTPEEMNGPGG